MASTDSASRVAILDEEGAITDAVSEVERPRFMSQR